MIIAFGMGMNCKPDYSRGSRDVCSGKWESRQGWQATLCCNFERQERFEQEAYIRTHERILHKPVFS
jgi:hypothetical protein